METVLLVYWEMIALYGLPKINTSIALVETTFSVPHATAVVLVWQWVESELPSHSLNTLLNLIPLNLIELKGDRLHLIESPNEAEKVVPLPLARCPWCYYYSNSDFLPCTVHPQGPTNPVCPDFKPEKLS